MRSTDVISRVVAGGVSSKSIGDRPNPAHRRQCAASHGQTGDDPNRVTRQVNPLRGARRHPELSELEQPRVSPQRSGSSRQPPPVVGPHRQHESEGGDKPQHQMNVGIGCVQPIAPAVHDRQLSGGRRPGVLCTAHHSVTDDDSDTVVFATSTTTNGAQRTTGCCIAGAAITARTYAARHHFVPWLAMCDLAPRCGRHGTALRSGGSSTPPQPRLGVDRPPLRCEVEARRQLAPRPTRTTQIVRNTIFKSCVSDQLST